MTGPSRDLAARTVDFGGLMIGYDERVLEPRNWTQAQSRWAAALCREAPAGPVLELCAGAGQIGLLAVAANQRRLVCVDADATAAAYARSNAERAGMQDRVEVRHADLGAALTTDERFPVVVADPPWVTTPEVDTFPEDPRTAIDGGADGLLVARSCVAVIDEHLAAGGSAVLQLGSAKQVEDLGASLARAGLRATEVREYGDRGVLALLER